MLLALALYAQDIPLNAPATEAVKCAQALSATFETSAEKGRVMTQSFYFLMRAAEADPGKDGKNLIDRTGDVAKIFARDRPTANAALLAQCDQRQPLARANGPSRLPAPGFDRDLMCVSVASYLGGLLEGSQLTLPGLDLKAIGDRYADRIPNSVLDQRNIRTDKEMSDALAAGLRASLNFGNMEAVARACAAAA